MELSLYGSQISLATRERTNTNGGGSSSGGNAHHYPRPGSAFQLHRPYAGLIKRPLSADSQYQRKRPSGSGAALSKRSTSSSSLQKSIQSEPISRYWESKTLTRAPPGATVQRPAARQMSKIKSKKRSTVSSKKKPVPRDSSEDESSMDEEDTQESNNDEGELENIWRGSNLKITPGMDKKPPLPRSGSFPRKGSAKKANASPAKVDRKMDLPGRVSFSSNDPYEIDYSDFDENEYIGKARDELTKASGSVTYDPRKFQASDTRFQGAKFDDDLTSSGYETKGDEKGQLEASASFCDLSESNKIIEDYKKEIEDINRRRDMELRLAQVDVVKTYDPKTFTPADTPEELFPGTTGTSATEDTDAELERPVKSLKKDVINEYYQCINEIITEQGDKKQPSVKTCDSKEDTIKLNLNNECKTTPKEKQFSPVAKPKGSPNVLMDKNKLDSGSNAVIKNYFKIKEQNINDPKCSKSNAKAMLLPKKNGKPIEKPKSADTHKSILRNAKKNNGGKVSPGFCREESHLSEFHMDKVVSWMSCNEDTFPKPYDADPELTPKCRPVISPVKTDDESNYNFDSRREAAGSEQTNYDDESLASEIAKPKSDFQILKTEVEYRLSNILDCADSQISSGCEENPEKDKVKDLFSYLDQVEMKCEKNFKSNLPSESDRSEMEFAAEPDYIEAVPKMSDLIELPQHQLARRVIKLSLRANELSNAMQLSKHHVATVKADKVKAIRVEKGVLHGKLKEQKKHYEDIIGRHQEFIDQLIKDKSGLCDKVTQLTRRLESQNQSWEHRLKTELERSKDTALAAEKIRREKWVRENTKKIKELTVKGLELEINKMTATHQKELADLKRQHKDEMVCAVSELKLHAEQKEADIRQNLIKDREAFLEKERQALLERFDKQVTEERGIFEQQRQHLLSEFDIEKERHAKEVRQKLQHFEAQVECHKQENAKNLDFAQKEYVQMLKQRENKHQEELAKLQKQYESDFTIWKRDHERASKQTLEERENAIRSQCRSERDQQIDRIVAKVDAETQKYQQDFDTKMNRLKEKHATEMKEMEASEALLKQKYQDTRSKLAEGEATVQNMKSTIKQTELQLGHSKKLCDDLLREKETMKEDARKEVQKDLANMQKDREREIERIYCRVQQAIDKKDTTIGNLQKEISSLKERCLKQDAIIRQQRIDYCIK